MRNSICGAHFLNHSMTDPALDGDSDGDAGPKVEVLTQTDKFTRNATVFGTVCAAFVAIKYFGSHWRVFAFIAFDVSVFYAIENQVKRVTNYILYDSKYTDQKRVPGKMIPYSFQAFNLCIISFIASLNQQIQEIHDLFCASILITTSLFSLSVALQAAALGTGAVSHTMMRRGFFGVCQHMFMITRSIAVWPLWHNYIGTKCHFKSFARIVYGVVKLILIGWMCIELKHAIDAFRKNKNRMFRSATGEPKSCAMCRRTRCVEPKVFDCGHQFCYRCSIEWFSHHEICPHCRQDNIGPIPIQVELANGFVPWDAFICAF